MIKPFERTDVFKEYAEILSAYDLRWQLEGKKPRWDTANLCPTYRWILELRLLLGISSREQILVPSNQAVLRAVLERLARPNCQTSLEVLIRSAGEDWMVVLSDFVAGRILP